MAYYPQYPPGYYAYHPMPISNQEIYAMYPSSGGSGAFVDNHHGWYDNGYHHHHHGMTPVHRGGHFNHHHMTSGSSPPKGHFHHHHKPGFNNRKISADSGISNFSEQSGRKTSSTSTISNASMILEEPALEDVKEEPPYEEPDDDLCEKIVQQVEFYFSDANITKDKFLLKHVRRNKEGFVSLKLISSFKRVKHLTRDWRQVASAVERKSDKLEVNDLKTKVRRLQALPEYDETTPSRTVVALNLPLERPTIEAVAEIFAKCGEIVLVRILRPGNPIPADIKPFANKHPEMTAKVCALIEFECTEFAHKAVKELNNEEEEKMKVMELTAPPAKVNKKDQDNKKKVSVRQQQTVTHHRRFSHAGLTPPQSHQTSADDLVLAPRRRISLFHNMKFTPINEKMENGSSGQQSAFALNPDAPTFQMHHAQRLSRPSPVSYMPPPPHYHHPHPHHHPGAMDVHMPWMMRRMSLVHHHHPHHPHHEMGVPHTHVTRAPRGPDSKGNGGFQKWCKSRMDQQTKKPGSRAVPIVAPPKEDKSDNEEIVDVPEEAQANPEQVVDGAAAVVANPAESGSDSGHEEEDAGFSDEPEMMDNERSR